MFEIPLSGGLSPSKTYMIGIHDYTSSPNGILFEKFILPESAPNNIKSAMQNYLMKNISKIETIEIVACISIEEYLRSGISNKEQEDINLALEMLHDWDAKQKEPAESYSVALANLLKQVALMDDFNEKLTQLKEKAVLILQIE